MDIYSNFKVPFNVGVWARGHKFNVTSVKLVKALKEFDDLSTSIARLERQRDAKEEQIKDIVQEAETKLGEGNGI